MGKQQSRIDVFTQAEYYQLRMKAETTYREYKTKYRPNAAYESALNEAIYSTGTLTFKIKQYFEHKKMKVPVTREVYKYMYTSEFQNQIIRDYLRFKKIYIQLLSSREDYIRLHMPKEKRMTEIIPDINI